MNLRILTIAAALAATLLAGLAIASPVDVEPLSIAAGQAVVDASPSGPTYRQSEWVPQRCAYLREHGVEPWQVRRYGRGDGTEDWVYLGEAAKTDKLPGANISRYYRRFAECRSDVLLSDSIPASGIDSYGSEPSRIQPRSHDGRPLHYIFTGWYVQNSREPNLPREQGAVCLDFYQTKPNTDIWTTLAVLGTCPDPRAP